MTNDEITAVLGGWEGYRVLGVRRLGVDLEYSEAHPAIEIYPGEIIVWIVPERRVQRSSAATGEPGTVLQQYESGAITDPALGPAHFFGG